MPELFVDPLHNEFGSWPLAYIPYGGADYGEILAVARSVGTGDDSAFYAAWTAAGDRLVAEAEQVLQHGHRPAPVRSFCARPPSMRPPTTRCTATPRTRAS